ncbi:hypothetical protein ACHAP8_011719 [Fusarium lateritium]
MSLMTAVIRIAVIGLAKFLLNFLTFAIREKCGLTKFVARNEAAYWQSWLVTFPLTICGVAAGFEVERYFRERYGSPDSHA